MTPSEIRHISEEEGKERPEELSGNVWGGHFKGKWGCIPASVKVSQGPGLLSAGGQRGAIGVGNPQRSLQASGCCAVGWFSPK